MREAEPSKKRSSEDRATSAIADSRHKVKAPLSSKHL